jgi:hypothetical protein
MMSGGSHLIDAVMSTQPTQAQIPQAPHRAQALGMGANPYMPALQNSGLSRFGGGLLQPYRPTPYQPAMFQPQALGLLQQPQQPAPTTPTWGSGGQADPSPWSGWVN